MYRKAAWSGYSLFRSEYRRLSTANLVELAARAASSRFNPAFAHGSSAMLLIRARASLVVVRLHAISLAFLIAASLAFVTTRRRSQRGIAGLRHRGGSRHGQARRT